MVKCYKASEQWTRIMEKQPSCRMWCMVEMQAALDLGKAVILKVGKFQLKDLPPEEVEIPQVKFAVFLFISSSFFFIHFDQHCFKF
jgi:hypothetical protein